MTQQEKNFCFCTFASGTTYRTLAKNLIGDIEKYSPGTPLVIFTDKPREFRNYSHVLPFEHEKQGVLCYHERRFAIAKALTMFDSCMYLDADVRICAPVPQNRKWLPGITARSSTNMNKHFQGRLNKTNRPRPKVVKHFEVYKKMAQKLDIDIEVEEITWINEFLFVVTRDSGKEIEFLEQWGKIALYAELNGIHNEPAYSIGLAAAKADFPIRHDVMEGLDFFDDRIEKIRISRGLSTPNAKLAYFETQKKIEKSPRSIGDKITSKIRKVIDYYYHYMRLMIKTARKDFNFYYR